MRQSNPAFLVFVCVCVCVSVCVATVCVGLFCVRGFQQLRSVCCRRTAETRFCRNRTLVCQASVQKTGRLIVAHEVMGWAVLSLTRYSAGSVVFLRVLVSCCVQAPQTNGFGAEIAAKIQERIQGDRHEACFYEVCPSSGCAEYGLEVVSDHCGILCFPNFLPRAGVGPLGVEGRGVGRKREAAVAQPALPPNRRNDES